jgi:hypothetical protein
MNKLKFSLNIFLSILLGLIALLNGNAYAQNANSWIPASKHPSKAYFYMVPGAVVNVTYNPTNFGANFRAIRSVNFKYEIRYPRDIVNMVRNDRNLDAVIDVIIRGQSNYLQSIDFGESYQRMQYDFVGSSEFFNTRSSVRETNLNDYIRNKIMSEITPLIRAELISIQLRLRGSGDSGRFIPERPTDLPINNGLGQGGVLGEDGLRSGSGNFSAALP